MFLKRSEFTHDAEKWCVELDLKDFHFHFGQSHFQTFCQVLMEKIETNVGNSDIKDDLTRLLSSLE